MSTYDEELDSSIDCKELPPQVLPGVERAYRDIIKALGLNPYDQNLKDTPKRAARAYAEIFEGLTYEAHLELKEHLCKTFPCSNDEMVIAKNITVWSMCPHHFLPVYYVANIGYLPNNDVLGISKLSRIVELLAKRPILQEELTSDIAKKMQEVLKPRGVAVKLTGQHLCMQMRGVKSHGTSIITSYVTGVFKENPSCKKEFFDLISLENDNARFN